MKPCEGILAVDFGTSNVRAALVNVDNGSILGKESAKYEWMHPEEGQTEISPHEIWLASQRTVWDLLKQCGPNIRIAGIGFSFFGDNVIPVDENGNELYNLLPAFDSRSRKEVEIFSKEIGPEKFIEITGGCLTTMCVGTKILWLRNNRRDVFDKARCFFDIQQYILKQLGLPSLNDFTMASRKMLYDVDEGVFSDLLLDVIGIDDKMLGEGVAQSSSVVGTVKAYGDVELPHEIMVALGAHDAECGLFGLGVHPKGGTALGDNMGTFDHIGCFTDHFFNTCSIEPSLYSYCGPDRSTFAVQGGVPTGGALLEWFASNVYQKKGKGVFDDLFGFVQFDGTGDLMMLPGFGASEGCIVGLNLSDNLYSIFRSIIEGISFETKMAVDDFNKLFENRFDCLRAGGGGAKSAKWLQLKANVTGKRVEKVTNIEVSCLGAAIIASTGMRMHGDFQQAIKEMVSVDQVFLPDETIHERYSRKEDKHISLRKRLKGYFSHTL